MKYNLLATISLSGLLLVIATLLYAAIDNRIVEIQTEPELQQFLNKHQQNIVFFYNPTCPVCLAFKKKKIFPEAASQLPAMGFGQISSKEGEKLHHNHHITAFPTFIYFKNGKELKRKVGYVDNPTFAKEIKQTFGDK